jgi:hypothetical protein
MLGAAASDHCLSSSDSSYEQLEEVRPTSFPSYDMVVVSNDVGVVAAAAAAVKNKDKKTRSSHLGVPYSPNTVVMDDIVSLDDDDEEEEVPCAFEPPRRSLFLLSAEQQQTTINSTSNSTMMLSSNGIGTTTKDDSSTFIFLSHDSNDVIHGQEEDEVEKDNEDGLWSLPSTLDADIVIMEEDDHARILLGLGCSFSSIEDHIQLGDIKRSLFSSEDNADMDHHHNDENNYGGSDNNTETENLFFQYWTDQGTTSNSNQVGASSKDSMMMG